MAKYLIHCCEKRKWYIDNFLVPSMIKQGIEPNNIIVYNDNIKDGCLRSFVKSSMLIGTTVGGTWHLQDDIVISSDFKEKTEKYDKGLVCGFWSFYSKDIEPGITSVQNMWYSFPCIRIPNIVLRSYIRWLNNINVQKRYGFYIERNKFVDYLFREFINDKYKDKTVHNLGPNIVDNVDYLLGGSTINDRDKLPVSLYFTDSKVIEELKDSLNNSVYKHD